MLDFTRSGLPNVSQSKSKFTTFLWSDNCSLFTDYTNLHLSLQICTCLYLYLSILSVLDVLDTYSHVLVLVLAKYLVVRYIL